MALEWQTRNMKLAEMVGLSKKNGRPPLLFVLASIALAIVAATVFPSDSPWVVKGLIVLGLVVVGLLAGRAVDRRSRRR